MMILRDITKILSRKIGIASTPRSSVLRFLKVLTKFGIMMHRVDETVAIIHMGEKVKKKIKKIFCPFLPIFLLGDSAVD